jgi:hypothetical protein
MVRIGEDVLSSQHFVQLPASADAPAGKWRPALHHPDAVPSPKLSHLYCLNVEGHRFTLASGLTVADYDETDSVLANAAAQGIAESALNGGQTPKSAVADYSLGLDPTLEVQLADNTWKKLAYVVVGDVLKSGATVLGTVEEECRDVRTILGQFHVSAAQLLFRHIPYPAFVQRVNGVWERAKHILDNEKGSPATLRQLVLSNTAPFEIRHPTTKLTMWARDYREVALSEMEEPFAEALETKA